MIRHKYEGQGYKGRLGQALAYDGPFLVSLYRSMLRIRMIECAIESRYHEDQMKTPIHLMIGQEATSVGACAAMRVVDQLWCTHRTHGNYLAKGGNLKAMMSELYCRANGCVGSRGGSMHLIDKAVGMAGTSAIVGGILPIATGAALASQLTKDGIVNLVFFGDAAVEQGATSESINFSVLKKLPLVFFCENNFYSVQSPLGPRQPNTPIWKRAAGFGINAVQIDGTNVLEVYEATQKACERAKRGDGPTFIEAVCYRYRAHGGAGDDSKTGYRDEAEVADWTTRADPLDSFRHYLVTLGVVKGGFDGEMKSEIEAEILAAFEHAINSPNPVEADLYTHVYSE